MSRLLRLRGRVSDNLPLALGLLVVLAALGGYVTHGTYVDPGTETERVVATSWESSGQFAHEATVTNGTAAFPEGVVLRNRTAYFRHVSPHLNGTFTYAYDATAGGNLTANATVVLVLRSVAEDRSGYETVYWRVERPLANATRAGLGPGEPLDVAFGTNASAAKARAEAIERSVGGTPGTPTVGFEARLALSGTRNGRPVERTRTYRLPLRFEQGVYAVGDDGPTTAGDEHARAVAVPVEYGPVRDVGGPLALVAGLVGVVGLLVARRTGRLAVSETEREWLAYRDDRAEFDDWITPGRVRAEAVAGPSVETESLGGLVDTAIDMDGRVLEDRVRDRFVVLTEGVTYVYEPPDPFEATADTAAVSPLDLDGGPAEPTGGEQTEDAATERTDDEESPPVPDGGDTDE